MSNVAVIVGRFQVPTLTPAHRELIAHAIKNYDNIILFIGKCPIVNSKNIIPTETIKKIISQEFYTFFMERDHVISFAKDVYNVDKWSKQLDDDIISICNTKFGFLPSIQDITMIGGRDSFRDNYNGIFTQEEKFVSLFGEDMSASKIREDIVSNGCSTDVLFLEGMIFQESRRYPTSFQTVDVAIISEDCKKILLGRKKHQDKFRFIGGFADPNSESLEEDAIREVFEETNVSLESVRYLFSQKIEDPRYKGTKDCIKTAFFIGFAPSDCEPIAKDDIVEVKWFDFNNLHEEDFVKEHIKLAHTMVQKLIIKKGIENV